MVERTVRLLDGTVLRVDVVDDGGAVRIVPHGLAFDEVAARPLPPAAPPQPPVVSASAVEMMTVDEVTAADAGTEVPEPADPPQQPYPGGHGFVRRAPQPAGPPPIGGVFAMLARDRPPQRSAVASSIPPPPVVAPVFVAAQPIRGAPAPVAALLLHPLSLSFTTAASPVVPLSRTLAPPPPPPIWDDGYDRPFMLGPLVTGTD